jgi:hypothetical protein
LAPRPRLLGFLILCGLCASLGSAASASIQPASGTATLRIRVESVQRMGLGSGKEMAFLLGRGEGGEGIALGFGTGDEGKAFDSGLLRVGDRECRSAQEASEALEQEWYLAEGLSLGPSSGLPLRLADGSAPGLAWIGAGLSLRPDFSLLTIESRPAGASLLLPSGARARCPVTLRGRPGAFLNLRVSLEGYRDQELCAEMPEGRSRLVLSLSPLP